jgi:Domain of unknown function (DUF4224)
VSLWLDDDELRALTGYRQRAKQIAVLAALRPPVRNVYQGGDSMSLVTIRVTLAEARQLLAYAEDRNEAGGWYYGSKKSFDKRHESIMEILTRAIERASSTSEAATP